MERLVHIGLTRLQAQRFVAARPGQGYFIIDRGAPSVEVGQRISDEETTTENEES